MHEYLPKRQNTRLKDFDYSSGGAYFITICTANRASSLSQILRRGDPCGRPELHLTELGELCRQTFETIENTYGTTIDKYAIMPDHVHFIVFLPTARDRATARVAPTAAIGAIVGGYKSLVVHKWLAICKSNGVIMGKLWQRNYYDHVIRDENDYHAKWQYIDENPGKWAENEHFIGE